MKAAIQVTDYLRRFATVVFYDQDMYGAVRVYVPNPGGDDRSEMLEPGVEIPDEFKLRLPIEALSSLAEEAVKLNLGVGQLDGLAALKLEQSRVDKLLDHLTARPVK